MATEMIFTDEDISALKKECDVIIGDIHINIFPGGVRFHRSMEIHCIKIKKLIARLEAAEFPLQWANRIGHMQECGLYKGSAICSCGFHQFYSAYEAWRKAAGK